MGQVNQSGLAAFQGDEEHPVEHISVPPGRLRPDPQGRGELGDISVIPANYDRLAPVLWLTEQVLGQLGIFLVYEVSLDGQVQVLRQRGDGLLGAVAKVVQGDFGGEQGHGQAVAQQFRRAGQVGGQGHGPFPAFERQAHGAFLRGLFTVADDEDLGRLGQGSRQGEEHGKKEKDQGG